MDILRLLIGMVGVFVTIVGIINVLFIKSDFSTWSILIIGAVMWIESIPIMLASEREERRNLIRKILKGEKD